MFSIFSISNVFFSICPIFLVSNVTGQNLELITKFLNAVPKQHLHQQLEQQQVEFLVDVIYSVPEVGTVVGGTLTRYDILEDLIINNALLVISGTIREGDKVQVGPNEECRFKVTEVSSIHRYRSPCRLVKAGQTATLALKDIDRSIVRKV